PQAAHRLSDFGEPGPALGDDAGDGLIVPRDDNLLAARGAVQELPKSGFRLESSNGRHGSPPKLTSYCLVSRRNEAKATPAKPCALRVNRFQLTHHVRPAALVTRTRAFAGGV